MNEVKSRCLNPDFAPEHKLLSQAPISNYLNNTENGIEMTAADKQKAYLWFIGFVYRLRNALFHEIIDPLNDEWQVIFKNAYHVLKQIVDQNIWRLNQLKLLPLASSEAAKKDYILEPPRDVVWPSDEVAKFTWISSEVQSLNKDGAKVLVKANIDFANYHYTTQCIVKWDETLSTSVVKNASIAEIGVPKEIAADTIV